MPWGDRSGSLSAWCPSSILDTCVLVAAFRSRTGASNALLRLVGTGRFDTALTTPLVLEYEAVLKRSPDDLGLTAADVTDLIDYLCRVGVPAEVRFRVRPSLPDPGTRWCWRPRWRPARGGW